MSGAEEAPPTLNATPAVVPSPDDSAKEVMEQELDVTGGGVAEDEAMAEDEGVAEDAAKAASENSGQDDEIKFIDVEGDEVDSTEGRSERLGSTGIDPSYNPSSEELLYEGDVEAEQPLPKAGASVDKDGGSQEEGFMISVHETTMELDLSETINEPAKEKAAGDNNNAELANEGGAKTAPSPKLVTESKKSSTPKKNADRFVVTVFLSFLSYPLPHRSKVK